MWGVNRPMNRRIFKTFLPGFRISAIAADWPQILDFACNKNIFAQISDSGRNFIGGFG